jgi:predicted RNA binding protein YcfA (HicA-like mRNA interferase family)
MNRTYRVRDLLHDLRRHGCRPLRTRGSHQVWTTSRGTRFGVVVNHPGDDVSAIVLACVRRTLRAAGIELGRFAHLSPMRTGGAA